MRKKNKGKAVEGRKKEVDDFVTIGLRIYVSL